MEKETAVFKQSFNRANLRYTVRYAVNKERNALFALSLWDFLSLCVGF